MAQNSGTQRRLGAIEGEVVSGRSLAQCEQVIESAQKVVRQAAVEMQKFAEALAEIREKRLYKVTHRSWDAYCSQRWGFTGRTANRQIEQVVAAIEMATGEWPSQRELARLREQKVGRASDFENNSDTQDVPSDDTQPREDQPADGEDPEGSAEHVSSDSPRVPGAGSTRGAGPPTAQDGGTVPDQDPGGVEPGGVSVTVPQEPSPVPASPPVAAADETGSPPPERTDVVTAKWLTIIAVTSVEDLRALGHNLVRDAAARLAAADGQKIVTLAVWDDMATELRCLREAAQVAVPAPSNGPPGRDQVELAVRALIDTCEATDADAFTRAGWGAVLTLTRKHLGPIIEKKAAASTKKEPA